MEPETLSEVKAFTGNLEVGQELEKLRNSAHNHFSIL